MVSASEAVRNFGALVDEVREARATYTIENHGKVVARVSPPPARATVADFLAWLADGPHPSPELLNAIADVRDQSRREAAPEPPVLSGRGGGRRKR